MVRGEAVGKDRISTNVLGFGDKGLNYRVC